jgi:hypothetical protein
MEHPLLKASQIDLVRLLHIVILILYIVADDFFANG